MASNTKPGIYKITNKINGKFYIGSAKDINRRWTVHRHDFRNQKHSNAYFQKAWNKYGESNFTFEVVLFCDIDDLLYYEQLFLDHYRCSNPKIGYNIRPIADSSIGIKHTDIARKNMSKAHLGIKMPPFSQEHKDKIRLGTRVTPNRKRKTVVAIDPVTGEEKYRFSGTAVLEEQGFNRGAVSRACKGLAKTHKGLIWQYAEEM